MFFIFTCYGENGTIIQNCLWRLRGNCTENRKTLLHFQIICHLKKWVKVTEPGKSIQSGMQKGLTRKHGKHDTQITHKTMTYSVTV